MEENNNPSELELLRSHLQPWQCCGPSCRTVISSGPWLNNPTMLQAKTPDSSSRGVFLPMPWEPLLPSDLWLSCRRALLSQNLEEEEGSVQLKKACSICPLWFYTWYFVSFEMPSGIEGEHAIFMNFQEGSWTNNRLRTSPRGFLPLLCVHITVLFITDISHLSPNGYTWKQHNNPELTDVCIPLAYLLLSDLEYFGFSATTKRFLATAEKSGPNAQSRNKDPCLSLSSPRRHPIWPSLAGAPRLPPFHPLKQETVTAMHPPSTPCSNKHFSGWFGKVQHWKQFLTQKIIYHGQSVENNLISNPFQEEKNWQLALSNLQHGHWESFIFPFPGPGLAAFRRDEE